MNDIEKKALLETAVAVAKAAGDRLKGISERRVNSDAGNDVKLQEDVESEMFIRAKLEETGIPAIGEEQGGDVARVNNGELYWIVDPIDGTYNYLRGIPGVCVSIALMKGWEPVVGVIYDFTRGELYAGGKKVIIFSQFTSFLSLAKEHIERRINSKNIFTLTGATRDRSLPVSEFQNAEGGALMFISLRAGGTGITLTSADYVFMADPWWNPAVEEQAIDRVHRIGRKGDVFIYRMIAQGTVEDRVRNLQSLKRTLFNSLVGGLGDVSDSSTFIETISDLLKE